MGVSRIAITTERLGRILIIPTHSVASCEPQADCGGDDFVVDDDDDDGDAVLGVDASKTTEAVFPASSSSSSTTTFHTKDWPVVNVADGRNSSGGTSKSRYG